VHFSEVKLDNVIAKETSIWLLTCCCCSHIQELHAGYIESQLLNQVRVVFPNQLLPIWIQNNTCVVVRIGTFYESFENLLL